VAKYQLQMTLLPLRIEVSYLGGQATAVPVDRMAQMFKRLTDEFPADMWTRLGYNFIYIIDCETKAIDVIAKQTIKTDVAGKLGATLLGAATWLWVQLDDSVLWVRLEPRNSDAQSKRASVNANFTASITGAVPAKEELARRLSTNMRTLEHMLGEIGLW